MKKTVTVITPTVGKDIESLSNCIESVYNQDYNEIIEHYIVIDGPAYQMNVNDCIKKFKDVNNNKRIINVLQLPYNIGNNGWNGHRIYAAVPYLVESYYIAYLDEDNTYDINHISSLMELVKKNGLDWVYSLRKIVNKKGEIICEDNCESLGELHAIWNDPNGQHHMCDTSTYLMDRKIAMIISSVWAKTMCQCHPSECNNRYHKKGRDREIYKVLKNNKLKGCCTKQYTLNYTVDENKTMVSVQADFFLKGNEYINNLYNNKLPWKSTTI